MNLIEEFIGAGVPIEAVRPSAEFRYLTGSDACPVVNRLYSIAVNPNFVRRKIYWALWARGALANSHVFKAKMRCRYKGSQVINLDHSTRDYTVLCECKVSNQYTEFQTVDPLYVDDEAFIARYAADRYYGSTPLRVNATIDEVQLIIERGDVTDGDRLLLSFLACYSETWIGREYRQ